MAWDASNSGNTEVVAENNGETRNFNISGNTKLKDAIGQVSSSMGYGSVLVTCDGRTVEPNEGDSPISTWRLIKVVPKMAGANDEAETASADEDSSIDDFGSEEEA